MGQNNIWMRYLALGIVINGLLLLGCGKIRHERFQKAEFRFVNKTNYDITYEQKGLESYHVAANKTITVNQTQDVDRVANATTYLSPFRYINAFPERYGIIEFNHTKCLKVTFDDAFGPLNIKNYVAEKMDKNTYKFTYTFTEEDYNRATACP